MRQHTVLNKPIRKLRTLEPKQTHHVSSKLLQKHKMVDRKFPSTSQKDSYGIMPQIIYEIDDGPETLRDPKEYSKIFEVPVYEASRQELADPFQLLKNIRDKGYEKYGAVKIRVPEEWGSHFAFNPENKNITTRKQVLKNLIKGKAFAYNTEGYKLDEFKEQADKFQKDYVYHSPYSISSVYRANEFEFWSHVEDPEYAQYNLTVEYAADLPSSKFGSGFPTVPRGRMTDTLDPHDLRTHPCNLNNLSQAKDSLFQVITNKAENISGISSPWMYVGMLFASFCWHVEDLYMYSVNYMHRGAPKTWYCVPAAYKEAFDNTIKEKYGELFIMNPALLYNITQTMNPLELVKRNIPVYRTEQKPGELIITFPKVYHAGFSHGFNVSEAVNVAAVNWLPYAKKAMEDYAADGFSKKGSFPYEWLIIENIVRLDELDFSNEAKQKLLEEYEEIKNKELAVRETAKQCYNKITIKKFANNAIKYDAYLCCTCKNYTYLSFLSCKKCLKTACTQHITVCDCLNGTIVLNVRYSNQELEEFTKTIRETETFPKQEEQSIPLIEEEDDVIVLDVPKIKQTKKAVTKDVIVIDDDDD